MEQLHTVSSPQRARPRLSGTTPLTWLDSGSLRFHGCCLLLRNRGHGSPLREPSRKLRCGGRLMIRRTARDEFCSDIALNAFAPAQAFAAQLSESHILRGQHDGVSLGTLAVSATYRQTDGLVAFGPRRRSASKGSIFSGRFFRSHVCQTNHDVHSKRTAPCASVRFYEKMREARFSGA